MKTNAYTALIKDIHAPAAAVERATAYARRESSAPFIIRRRRPLIAAAIALMLLSVGIIYGIFLSPASTVYLDSRESAAITLNSRGRALSDGYDGMTAREAVAAVTREMLDSGALDEDENTLIIGASKLSEEAQAALLDTVQNVFAESRFHGAIICLPGSDQGAKSAVIGLLADAVDSFGANDLKHLSANDLNLLLHEYGVSEGVTLSGVPSESGYIGKDAAEKRARENSQLDKTEISVTYLPYRGMLVYLVRIIGEDRAEAFFINAASGAIETALRTTRGKLEQEIRAEVKAVSLPNYESPTVRSAVAVVPQKTVVSTVAVDTQPTTLPETVAPTFNVPVAPSAEPATESAPIITDNGSYGTPIPFTQLWMSDEVEEIDGVDESTTEHQLYIIGSVKELLRCYYLAESDGCSTLQYYLSTLENSGEYSDLFFRDNAIVIAACYFSDDMYSVSPNIDAIERKDDTLYVAVHCCYQATNFNHQAPLLHKDFVSAQVSKSDIQNIDAYQLALIKDH